MITTELGLEEERFSETLQKGEKEFEKLLPNLLKNPQKIIPGRVAFRLYDTYGFPIEITEELAREHGMAVDRKGFDEAFEKHQELSKAGAEKVFKGGLADHSEMTTKLHTATHLLTRRSAWCWARTWRRRAPTSPWSGCVSTSPTPSP